jgi:hypothetical protein
LQNFRARFYDEDLFRFYAMDPAGQFKSPYAFSGNSPMMYVDPSGKIAFLPILIGAAIGGLINLGTQAYMASASGRSFSVFDGFVAFGIGAVAGGVGVATGGFAFAAAGGAAGGGGGFVAGAASGMAGYLASSPIQITGNALYFDNPIPTPGQFLTGLATSGLGGGLINGTIAAWNGKSFWNGVSEITSSVPTISNTTMAQAESGIRQQSREILPDENLSLPTLEPSPTALPKTTGINGDLPPIATLKKTVVGEKTIIEFVYSGKTSSNVLLNTKQQLQSKFNHAKAFGVMGNPNKVNVAKFSAALNQHINSEGVQIINGTYKGMPVIHYLDPKTNLNVITSPTGKFISGWKLNADQLKNVLNRGKL